MIRINLLPSYRKLRDRQQHRERMRQYRAANPEKVKEAGRKWRASNPEYKRKWAEAHPGYFTEAMRRWVKNNPERDRANKKRFWENHPGYRREWAAKNPDKAKQSWTLASLRRRGVRVLRRLNHDALLSKFAYFGNKCVYCGSSQNLQIEHIKPVSKGGSSLLCNLAPACAPCNMKKGAKWTGPRTWRRCID